MYRQKNLDGKPRRLVPSLILGFGCVYFGLAAGALLFEPTALVVRETTITTTKITKPIAIVFASDFQTDHVGRYERWTLQKIKEQNADLILFGGDYAQGRSLEQEQQILHDWNQLFQKVNLQAPLGIYAIQGNVGSMQGMFENTAIIPLEQTISKSIGEIRVTFLSLVDSATPQTIPDEEQESKFRIIVGHMPNYAMATQEAELLLAGHTHGGQVQIPFWGLPLVTASGTLPRSWATGMTSMSNGALLIVSHGTGMERGKAPRVRFHCRPDFWVIRLVPAVK
jgi:predicted MPP superfamily phosphohydrolase